MQTEAPDMRGRPIVQFGIVVPDAELTARRYTELLGVGPWVFLEMPSADFTFRGSKCSTESCVRVALANFGKFSVELLQPLFGSGTHMEFIRRHGAGVHHLSFGQIDHHDQIVSALEARGIGIEMQGTLPDGSIYTYLDTIRDLGTVFEVVKPPPADTDNLLPIWGLTKRPGSSVMKMEGKKIVQVGIVVRDAEKTAHRYEELLGIGPWKFMEAKWPRPRKRSPEGKSTDTGNTSYGGLLGDDPGILHDVPMIKIEAKIKLAVTEWEGLELEVIEPQSGPGSHWEFLKVHGPGIHHFSFGVIADHDDCVAALRREGCGIEMSALMGKGSRFTYMNTSRDLGTLLEFAYVPPGVTFD